MIHYIEDTYESSASGPTLLGLHVTGLSALWPVLILSLVLLVGCKNTPRVAETADPFLPTRTVATPAAVPASSELATQPLAPAQLAPTSVKQDSQVLKVGYQPVLSEPLSAGELSD
ncbi:hypothetical protein [Adhaeretor mobilis]|uniref:Uncharacterized protein n=1 Tax=Adhaeretor mobilis TaxID=1930276 RepID=A0A517MUY7_9BACT|nr:hypothetical protein [Adhaeretor mobilis]QDS98693.1 hypothetical protein HG15A2_19740 [Adhaeretor mobilis]